MSLCAASPFSARPLLGQSDDIQRQIRESQQRLEEIRAERERLQREMANAQLQVEDVSAELRNIERQLSASRSVLAEMEFQAEMISAEVATASVQLVRTRERLLESNAILNRRLRDIYKLGGLHTTRVLLSAESFSDLISRYLYLERMASYDRSLVRRVRQLETALVEQTEALETTLTELDLIRRNKATEVRQLTQVELDRQSALERFRQTARRAESRLEQLEADIARLTSLVDELEERRLAEERRRSIAGRAAGPATLGTADAGSLDWPVEGDLLYRFGRERRPNGTVLRWNGIGIAAPRGSPVRAVQDGTVVLAGPFEGYGPTVVISHGGGFYTLYLYLEDVGVLEGRQVSAGQVIGTVGGEGTPEGAHIEFQIRAPRDGGTPQAMDPLQWLRARNVP
ncbi:MAG: peptidoglycan DD-metalloendopeptidase family protein [Longimicrobiales bacterium]|nr:peptidoglycan DD-metalloendopeptidase family protein [Longimicrobiales bacterium]